MRVVVSLFGVGHQRVPVVADCAPGARVADLAGALAAVLPAAPQVVPHGRLGVVRDAPVGRVPALWHDGLLLDPSAELTQVGLRQGSSLGLGGPDPVPADEPHGVVEIRVVSGSEAGRVYRLAPGLHTLGRDTHCDVRVVGDEVPTAVAALDIAVDGSVLLQPDPGVLGLRCPAPVRRRPLDGPVVAPAPATARRRERGRRRSTDSSPPGLVELDPEDERPLLALDRVEPEGPTAWPPGASLVVGDVVLEVAQVQAPDASLSPSPDGLTLDYNRPPRLLPPARPSTFRLPTEPRSPERAPFPLAMLVLPVLLGGVMFWFTHNALSLVVLALSPLMALANWSSTRRGGARRHAAAVAEHAERVTRIENEAYDALVAEARARRHDLPDPAQVLLFVTGPRARLWERRRDDPDRLLVRVGTADVPSEVSVHHPARDEHRQVQRWTAPDVPVGVPLAQVGVTGVAGPPDRTRRLAGWMLAQAVAAHTPADLSVVVLAQDEEWAWTRWLPHVRRDDGVPAAVGTDEATQTRRIGELVDLVERRQAAARERDGGLPSPTVLVVLDGARRLRLLPGVVTLLREGPQVGVLALCLDADERALPQECRAVVDLGPSAATVAVHGGDPVDGVRPDLVTDGWFDRLATALAPVRDIGAEDLSTRVPTASRLLEVLQLDPPTAAAVADRWQGPTTRVVVGETGDGPFRLDLRADGPHGLVAGTTGSGKSELLQTLIASLAVVNRPDEMTFVLVDYKGGAAFKDCSRLPHTVGMVTDLDAHLTGRALESLGAELRRREHQLASLGAKDIEDYLAARGPQDPPLPRLVLVIDEFAALVAELPDFVAGLVDIARRGRSLGVHLLLATQRPAGVVSAEIRSNTTLRLALRVTDTADSQDVLDAPDAALIPPSLPGRAYARLSAQSLVPFQASRVGGRPPSAQPGGGVVVAPFDWAHAGRDLPAPAAAGEQEGATDLSALVAAVQEAAASTGAYAPAPPWLEPLPDVLTLAGLDTAGLGPLDLPFGLVDLPDEQRREVATLDLTTAGNLAVVGAPRSGRSTVLRVLAGSVAQRTSPQDVHLYAVDCGNNALLPLVALPHTGAVVTRDQPDRLARLTRRLRAEISRRQQLLAAAGLADVTEQRTAGDEPLPYLLVLLDRWEGFLQAFEDYDSGVLLDLWVQILQEGPAAGVRVVVTGDRSLLVGRVATVTEDRLMLRMPEPSDFAAVGLTPREVPERMGDGRAFRSEGSREVQVALLDDDPAGAAQVAALQSLARAAQPLHPGGPAPFRVDVLPTRITLAESIALPGRTLGPHAVPAGVGGDSLALFGLDALEHGPGALVLGPRRSGRSTALATMATSALQRGWRVGLVLPRRSPLAALADEVAGVLTSEANRDQVREVLSGLLPDDERPSLLLVDDLELVGTDGPLADGIVEHLTHLRDRPALVVGGGTTDELGAAYRGPAAALKRSRSGVLLSPASPNDADVFGVRLPRSALGSTTPGRGVLATAGTWQVVQVPVP